MLSICIPIYNFDVTALVNDLHQQAKATGIDFEIICFDDGSSDDFKILNRKISSLKHLFYNELAQNLGRSKIRNELGKAAQYPYLLFMDCDSATVNAHYIERYIEHCQPNQLVYGGRIYSEQVPPQKELYFHWYYGSNREVKAVHLRRQNPWANFMTNNFLIPKTIFLDIQFDESLTQYGHEDTLFGWELQQRRIHIEHINNPLMHIGLEDTASFLMKTKKGIQNLKYLAETNPLMDSKLLQYHHLLRRMRLTGGFRFLYTIFEKRWLMNLHSQRPSLRIFDLYKLGYLATISAKK